MEDTKHSGPGVGYYSFLVRLWSDSPSTNWHASSENTLTGEKYSFATFDLLVHFLQSQTRDPYSLTDDRDRPPSGEPNDPS
jgi:hypothetical protein